MTLNLTEVEQLAIDSEINLSDGHPRQALSDTQRELVQGFPELFWLAESEPFADLERRAQTAFLGALGQSRAPVDGGRVFSALSSSVATMVLANILSGHRLALLHPTFDNIHALLSGAMHVLPVSERECAKSAFSDEVARTATCVFVTTPNNPTGWVLDEAALENLAGTCAARRQVLCLDVSFRGFDLRAQFDHYAILERSGVEYVVIEDSGKLWPFQELKLGFLAVSEGLRASVAHALSDVLLTVSPFVLKVVESLSVDAARGGFARMHRLIADNRRMVMDVVDGLDRVELLDPDARISVARVRFPSAADADRTRIKLLDRGIHVLPCRQFHWARPEEGARLIRIALSRNGEELAKGLEHLSDIVLNERARLSMS